MIPRRFVCWQQAFPVTQLFLLALMLVPLPLLLLRQSPVKAAALAGESSFAVAMVICHGSAARDTLSSVQFMIPDSRCCCQGSLPGQLTCISVHVESNSSNASDTSARHLCFTYRSRCGSTTPLAASGRNYRTRGGSRETGTVRRGQSEQKNRFELKRSKRFGRGSLQCFSEKIRVVGDLS